MVLLLKLKEKFLLENLLLILLLHLLLQLILHLFLPLLQLNILHI
tara:strand:+ start:591 stop:725 length:135 start_codon:yes stop_codon:yes gene_type:complete